MHCRLSWDDAGKHGNDCGASSDLGDPLCVIDSGHGILPWILATRGWLVIPHCTGPLVAVRDCQDSQSAVIHASLRIGGKQTGDMGSEINDGNL